MRSHSTARLLVSILFLFVFTNSYGQCNANAGPNKTKCAEASVTLGAATPASGNAPFTYSWSPATGLSCTNCANPVCTATVFTVYTLTITDDDGCTDSDNVNVNISPAPNANFTFAGNNGCGSTPIQFTSTSTGTGLTYAWNFGNPASGSANTSTQTNPQHEFISVGTGSSSFNVSLIVTNAAGCKDTMIQTVTVQQTPGPAIVDPIASFKNCDGLNYDMTIYDASATVGGNYTIIWGDGSPNFTATSFPGTGANHLYSTSDIFDLYYIVTGTNGCSDTVHQLVSNITNPAIGAANPGATTGCGPMTLCFPLSNYSANHNSTYYVVDYGDGSPMDTLPHPPPAVICHTYTASSCGQPGNAYTFKMKAINSCDSSLASISPIRVYSGPQANFTVPTINGCVGSALTFLNTSILGFNSSCSASTVFTWNFGDGQSLTTIALTSPSHVYTVPGNYTVTLSTTNACGTTTHSATVCIESPPVPNFTLSPATACVPFNTQVTNLSTVINACNVTYTWSVIFNGSTCAPSTGTWSFINSTNATSFAPEFQFVSPGQYTVRLTMTNSCGTFIFDQPVVGQAPPQVTLAGLPSICAGTSVSPTAVVNNCYEPVDTYDWTFVGGSPSSSNLLVPGPVLYANPGSYTVQLQATNVCGSITATTPLIVFAPPVANAGPDVQFCSGGSSVIGSAPVGGVSYSWSPTTGLSSPSSSTSTVSLTNATAAPTVNQYVVTASSSASCFTTDTVLVTVNPLPILVVNSPTICFGQSANLTVSGAGAGGNYTWSPSTALSCTNCDSPISTPTATTVYTITGTNVYGCLSSITSTVTVNPLPVVNAGPDQTLCNQPIPVTLSGTPVGGTWTGSPNVTSAGIFTPNGVEVAQLVYSYTNPSTLCTNTDTLIVTVNPPVIPTLDPLDSLCINAAITNLNTLLNASPLGGVWSGTGVTNPNFDPSTAGVGSHTMTYTFGTGTCLVQVTSSINVNPLPVISVNSGTICAGQNLSLVASGAGVGGSYSWTPATNLSCTTCPNPLADPLSTISYTVTGTNAFGCSSSAISTVTVNPLPVVSAGPDQLLCDQAIPFTLTGTPSGGTWTGSPNVTSAGTFTPNGSEVSTLYYSYTVPATGCSQIDSMVVTVSPPVVPTVNPTYSICVNSASVNLNTELAPSPLGGTWSGTGVTNPTFNPATAGVGSFTVTYSYGSATCLSTVSSTITVNPQPSLLVNSATICNTDSVNLLVSGAGAGGTYSWSPTATLSCTNCDSLYADPSTTTTYTVTGTNSFGCSSSSNSIVTVNPLPMVSAGPDLTLCNQAIPVTLVGTPVGGTWTGSPNVSAGGIFTPNGVEVVTIYYSYTIPATGCSNLDSTIVTVNPLVVPTVDPTYALCVNNPSFNLTTTLNANPVGGIWSGTGVTNPNFNPATAGVGTHTLNYAYGTGTCLSTTTTQITVYSQPTLSVNNATICNGQSTVLTVSGAGAGGNYTWSPGTALSCTNCSNPTANPTSSIVYSVSGTTLEGCSNTASASITVNPLPVVNAGIDQTLCDQPIPVTLSGTPVGGTWSGSPNVTSGGVFTPNGPETSTLYYTYTIPATGCTNLDSMIMTVVPPVVPTVDPTYSLCVYNSPINLNTVLNPSNLGGTWSGPGVTNPSFNPATAGVGTHTVSYTYGTGTCLNIVTSAITVNPQPTISVNSGVICNGQSIVLNASGAGVGGNYSWTPTTALSCTNCASPTANPITTTTYTVTGTTAEGCSNTANSVVTVNPLPVVNAGIDQTLCNQPIPFTLSGTPVGGTWSGSPNVTAGGIFTPNGTEVTTLYYTYTLPATGCVNLDSMIMTVVPPVIPTIDPSYSLCIYEPTINLNTVLNPSQLGGTWSGTGVTNPTFNPATAGVGTHTVTYSYGAGTCLNLVTSAITVNPQPTVTVNSGVICNGQSIVLNASGAGVGGNYTWTPTTALSCTNCDTPTANPTSTTTYTVTGTTAEGCSNTANSTVTVNPLPVVNAGNDTTLCNLPIPVQFTGTIAGGTWAGTDVNATGLFSPTSVGTFTLTYTVTLGTGCTDSDTKDVQVVAPIFANAGLDAEYCIDQTTATVVGLPSGGTWTGTNVNTSGLFTINTAGNFPLVYTTGAGNCLTRDTMIMTIHALPIVNAGNDLEFCLTDAAQNLVGAPVGGTWTGTGITNSSAGTFDPQVATVGLHEIVYSFTDPITTCVNTDTLYVDVHPLPVVSFNFNPIICETVAETFNNTSTLVNSTQWNFGDGSGSSVNSPSHSYSTTGFYPVQAIVTTVYGCVDSLTQTIEVREVPVPNFALTPDSSCGPVSVNFTNNSTGIGLSYAWDFGNGQTSTSQNPGAVTYVAGIVADTTYTIELAVTNMCGTVYYYDSVIVMPTPTAIFGPDFNSGCSPFTANFASVSLGLPDSYYWDFGNGVTSATTDSLFQQTYTTGATPTDYTIMLVVINECGTDTAYHTITATPNNVNAFFNTSATTSCNNLTVDFTQYTLGGTLWSWDFGDGTTSSQYSPSHTYPAAGTYDVSLFANDGCSFDTTTVTIVVNQPPVVDFSVLPDSVCINTPFSFINESVGAVSSYWTFGDGTNSSITSPTHFYSASGNYQVTLVGTSLLNGCSASVTQTVHVSVNPVSQFTLNPSNGCVPLDVQFTNQSSGAAFYSWDFGDGNTSALPNPNHTYSSVGVFTAQLIVENANGCIDTSYQNVTVHGLPTANFTSSYNCTTPVTIDFTNQSTGAIGYSWDFGNGQTSTLTNPTGQYATPGNYTVTLTATNQYGCQEIAQQVVTVYPAPTINFASPAVEICADSVLTFTANTTFTDSVVWNMGDGTFITGNPISYSYQQVGNYLVSATAYGGAGCSASFVSNTSIVTHPQAIADFNYVNILSNDQSNGLVEFDNNSSNATSFLWVFGDGQSSTEFNPTHLYNGYNFYTTTLYANNSFGCNDSMTINVEVEYFHGLFLPNAMYPGHTSYEVSHFVPKGVGLKEFELLIYDDWGNLIWQTTALDANGRPTEAWDGTFEGEPVQQDAYVWKVTAIFIDESVWEGKEYKEKKFKKAGTVTVIR